ncbi:MAG TPA: acylphosphatase [Humisphaera sp.]
MQVQTPVPAVHTAPPQVPPTVRRTVHFGGRVQGVGFRYTARNIAQQHDVVGYVRNLADGRVELVLEGSDREISRTVDEIRRKMSGFVRGVTTETSPATGEFDHFLIRH